MITRKIIDFDTFNPTCPLGVYLLINIQEWIYDKFPGEVHVELTIYQI